MTKLSVATYEMVRRLFAPEHQTEVSRVLATECGNNLPFLEYADEERLERVRFAVLKLSQGNIYQLRWWAGLAQEDWNGVLAAAGFNGSSTAHRNWAKEVYGRTSTPLNGK